VLRDVLLNEIPLVFRKDIYASASLVGGGLYFALTTTGLPTSQVATLAVLAVVGLRLAAMYWKWDLPSLRR
jgi:uncharacterized membrane protein YeiH